MKNLLILVSGIAALMLILIIGYALVVCYTLGANIGLIFVLMAFATLAIGYTFDHLCTILGK